ncbi:MAG: hypothetical protein FWC64_10170, partial [Treponema sp.]|nr:hypothetical protein [Treponema sp.]
YMARVLGSHVLETEHGQIRLGHFSRILVAGGAIGIEAENFKLYRGALVATIGGVVAVGGVVVVARRKKL